jgi:hypothetical protein
MFGAVSWEDDQTGHKAVLAFLFAAQPRHTTRDWHKLQCTKRLIVTEIEQKEVILRNKSQLSSNKAKLLFTFRTAGPKVNQSYD